MKNLITITLTEKKVFKKTITYDVLSDCINSNNRSVVADSLPGLFSGEKPVTTKVIEIEKSIKIKLHASPVGSLIDTIV